MSDKTSTTGIVTCACQHDYQDAAYGKGRRLANRINAPAKNGGMNWRCTVCQSGHLHAADRRATH